MPKVRRLDVRGELTIMTAAEYHGRIRALVADGGQAVLGLSGVTELDTAGLQILLFAVRESERVGTTLTLREPSEAVTDILAIARLDLAFAESPADTELET